jgi:hypothetical protein
MASLPRVEHTWRLQAIQLFYSIAAMNALSSSMAWCVAKPHRWSILALLTLAVL